MGTECQYNGDKNRTNRGLYIIEFFLKIKGVFSMVTIHGRSNIQVYAHWKNMKLYYYVAFSMFYYAICVAGVWK